MFILSYELQVAIGYLIYIFATLSGLIVYKSVDKPGRIIFWLLVLTLFTEIVAYYLAHTIRNNGYAYGIFNPIQLFVISLYFNYSIPLFKKYHIGIYTGCIGCVLGIINFTFIQSLSVMNSYFLLTESLIIVTMCLYSFYSILMHDDDMQLHTYVHFWFTAILFFFWIVTFLYWGLYDFMRDELRENMEYMYNMLTLANIVTYIGIGVVFLRYRKMQAIHHHDDNNIVK